MQVASEADEVLLVVDAMTGQEAATLASVFNEKIGITGAVLTKMDGDTRGGAALSVQGVSQKPIKFVGVGEKVTVPFCLTVPWGVCTGLLLYVCALLFFDGDFVGGE